MKSRILRYSGVKTIVSYDVKRCIHAFTQRSAFTDCLTFSIRTGSLGLSLTALSQNSFSAS